MAAQVKVHYTPQEYLALERQAEVKSEYIQGEIFALTGGSEEHNLIALNIGSELRTQIKGKPCRVYPNDRGKKFERYKSLLSVTDYILVAQDEALLDHYARQPRDQWLLTTARGRDSHLHLAGIGCTLWLAEVYDKVEFAVDQAR